MTVQLAALVVVQQPLLGAEIRWREDAVLDPLTGLLNRQGLHRRFREVAEQARLTQRPVALVLFDLDRFKDLNDAHRDRVLPPGRPERDGVIRGLQLNRTRRRLRHDVPVRGHGAVRGQAQRPQPRRLRRHDRNRPDGHRRRTDGRRLSGRAAPAAGPPGSAPITVIRQFA